MDNNASDESHETNLNVQINWLRDTILQYGESHPERPHLLRHLSDTLYMLFEGDGWNNMELADEVLDLQKAALALTPPDHPEIYHYKFDLAASLFDHFDDTGIVEYLCSATSLYQDVMQSLSDISSDGLPAKHNLLLLYALRTQVLFLATHRQEDIDTSIAAFIEYTNAILDEHWARKLAHCFWMMAGAMLNHHAQFPSVDNLDKGAHSALIPDSITDNTMTIYRFRRPSGRPPDYTHQMM